MFKVGDKVEIIKNPNDSFLKNNMIYLEKHLNDVNKPYYTIVFISECGALVLDDDKDRDFYSKNNRGCHFPSRFKLYEEPDTSIEKLVYTTQYIKTNTWQPMVGKGDTVSYIGKQEHFRGMSGIVQSMDLEKNENKGLDFYVTIKWNGYKKLISKLKASDVRITKVAPVKQPKPKDYYRYCTNIPQSTLSDYLK